MRPTTMDDQSLSLDIRSSPTQPQKIDRVLKIVLTTVSSDSHTWNLVFLQLYLEELGHEVRNLGPCVPDEIIVEECRRFAADMLVVSSVNGHGGTEGTRLIKLLRRSPGLSALPVVIGGKLGTRGAANIAHSAALIDAGFDAVFEAQSGPDDLGRFIQGHSRAVGRRAAPGPRADHLPRPLPAPGFPAQPGAAHAPPASPNPR